MKNEGGTDKRAYSNAWHNFFSFSYTRKNTTNKADNFVSRLAESYVTWKSQKADNFVINK